MALLLLAHAAMPGQVEAATVDHRLRAESAAEAALVAQVCDHLGVPHRTLPVAVKPGNLQAQARDARYAALGKWLDECKLGALLTAHHADDQAETLLMRLNRGSGVAGLAGVRACGAVPGSDLPLLRPLLGWRRAELAALVADAGLAAVNDPANGDPRYDRARLRAALAAADWIDPGAIAQSAVHLAEADAALDWAARREWDERVRPADGGFDYTPGAPRAVRLRVLARMVGALCSAPRGGALAKLEAALFAGHGGNLGGCLAKRKGEAWVLRREPPRRR